MDADGARSAEIGRAGQEKDKYQNNPEQYICEADPRRTS
jgi:hypothetical protein